MADASSLITVHCPCGNAHRLKATDAGKLARCPVTKRPFRVPRVEDRVEFVDQAPPVQAKEPQPAKPADAAKRVIGAIAGRVQDAIEHRREQREVHRLSHSNCPSCGAENPNAALACAKCGCPLGDERLALAWMEQRRREAHEIAVAREGRSAAPSGPVNVAQKVVVRRSGCLTAFTALAAFTLMFIAVVIWAFVRSCGETVSRITSRPAVVTTAPARPSTVSDAPKPTIEDRPGLASKGDRYVERHSGVTVAIDAIGVVKTPLKNPYGGGVSHGKELALNIVLKIRNGTLDQKLDYPQWQSKIVATQENARLVDDRGNRYKHLSWMGVTPVYMGPEESIYPGGTATHHLVFERPIPNAARVQLTLPGKALGVEGDFEFDLATSEIPGSN